LALKPRAAIFERHSRAVALVVEAARERPDARDVAELLAG
jgi:hypothetical protein